MNKAQTRWLLIGAPIILLFNLLFFLLGGNQPVASVWISYGFIHLAYLQFLLVPFIVPKSKSSHLFLETTATISAAYFIIELAIGVLFIVLKLEPELLALSIQLIILCASILAILINHLANSHTADAEEQKKRVQKVFKDSLLALSQAMATVDEKEKAYLQSLYMDLKASPLLTGSALQGIENNIQSECEAIEHAAAEGNTDAIRLHGSVLSQLILIRKQSPSD